MEYILEIYPPGDTTACVAEFFANTPFMAIAVGDWLAYATSDFEGLQGKASGKALGVRAIEHYLSKHFHKLVIYTKWVNRPPLDAVEAPDYKPEDFPKARR